MVQYGGGSVMLYPELQSKFRIVRKKFHYLGNRTVAEEFNRQHPSNRKDQSTIGRHLRDPDPHDEQHQTELIRAVCNVVNKRSEAKISISTFKVNDLLAFCGALNIDKLEAASHLGKKLPIPEIFLDSLFTSSEESKSCTGHYIVFRDDKVKDRPSKPYMQACAEISEDPHGLPIYEDTWDGDNVSSHYKGYVFFLGTIVNIVGEARSYNGITPKPEIWWCGLQVRRERSGKVIMLYGYVSDIGPKFGLFADRIVLVRVTKDEWERVRNAKEFYVARERVSAVATETMARYLDDWKNHSAEI
jgi:hypothetical protein